MANHPTWFVGDRNPAITDTITIDGVPVDLSAKTVTFKMRAVGSSTLKVNTAVSTKTALGVWTYNWGASDLDTAGTWLVWVTVDMGGGALETVNEDIIRVQAHAPLTNGYVELEEFKSTASLTGFSFADNDIQLAITAASRGIDEDMNRRFYPDADAAQVRYYSAIYTDHVRIDDLITLTSLTLDTTGLGSYGTTWSAGTEFRLEPIDAVTLGVPFTTIRTLSHNRLPAYPSAIKVTGKFGWTTPPDAVKMATTIIATRLLLRARQAPFGVVSVGLEGAAVRAVSMARDPEIGFLLDPYAHERVLV